VAGITRHPDEEWMVQIARSATQETWGYLYPCRYILHDRDTKFCASFWSKLAGSRVKALALPARSPNLNAFAERWVRSVKEECLSKLILFGEGPLSRTLAEFSAHHHGERNHQGKGNKLLFPEAGDEPKQWPHRCMSEHLVLYPVDPNSLASYRKSFRPSGAKDDPDDASLLLDMLVRHRDRLRRLKPDTVETHTLQFLVTAASWWTNELGF
jgi:hypothetical protein